MIMVMRTARRFCLSLKLICFNRKVLASLHFFSTSSFFLSFFFSYPSSCPFLLFSSRSFPIFRHNDGINFLLRYMCHWLKLNGLDFIQKLKGRAKWRQLNVSLSFIRYNLMYKLTEEICCVRYCHWQWSGCSQPNIIPGHNSSQQLFGSFRLNGGPGIYTHRDWIPKAYRNWHSFASVSFFGRSVGRRRTWQMLHVDFPQRNFTFLLNNISLRNVIDSSSLRELYRRHKYTHTHTHTHPYQHTQKGKLVKLVVESN